MIILSILFGVGIILRLHAIHVYEHEIVSDELSYHAIAVNILDGNPYSRDLNPPFRPEYQRTPGYPLFVAATYAVFGRDPHAPTVMIGDRELTSVELTDEALRGSDFVLILTDHSAYDFARIADLAPLVVDTRNAINRRDLEHVYNL